MKKNHYQHLIYIESSFNVQLCTQFSSTPNYTNLGGLGCFDGDLSYEHRLLRTCTNHSPA